MNAAAGSDCALALLSVIVNEVVPLGAITVGTKALATVIFAEVRPMKEARSPVDPVSPNKAMTCVAVVPTIWYRAVGFCDSVYKLPEASNASPSVALLLAMPVTVPTAAAAPPATEAVKSCRELLMMYNVPVALKAMSPPLPAPVITATWVAAPVAVLIV